MNALWDRLAKLNPPPFLTVPFNNNDAGEDGQKKQIRSPKSWTMPPINYASYTSSLEIESLMLAKFIQRKGVQLRLEKALLQTKQISKLTLRWKKNEFHSQLIKFQEAFPNNTAPASQRMPTNNNNHELRLPTHQWIQWIIYLALREAALLAKMKLECEKAVEYWFGLISKSHHWGDSLVVASTISRIWHLSSVMVQELNTKIYPFLLLLTKRIQPIKNSASWPDPAMQWELTQSAASLVDWLAETMNIPFEPANMSLTLSSVEAGASVQSVESLMTKLFNDSSSIRLTENISDGEESESSLLLEPVSELNETTILDNEEEEDFGTVIIPCGRAYAQPTKSEPLKKKPKKNEPKMKGKNLKKVKTKNKKSQQQALTQSKQQQEQPEGVNPRKQFRLHWKKFFKNFQTHMTSGKGRKQLLTRIKRYKNIQQEEKSVLNSKIRLKLIKLAKVIRNVVPDNDNDLKNCLSRVQNFENFIQKQTKKIKIRPQS